MKTYVSAKLHGLRVTLCNLEYDGSVTLDPMWLRMADIEPYEQVHILNCTNGSRMITYAIPGEEGQGQCEINGAAAHHATRGDEVLIVAYRMFENFPGAKVLRFSHERRINVIEQTKRYSQDD